MTRRNTADPDSYAVELDEPVTLTDYAGRVTAFDAGTVQVPLEVAHQLVDLAGGTTASPLPDPSSIATTPAADGPPVVATA